MATPHTRPRPSFVGTVRQTFAQSGYRGFFRGLGPTILRAFPVNASAIWVYEGLMRTLGAEKVSSIQCSSGLTMCLTQFSDTPLICFTENTVPQLFDIRHLNYIPLRMHQTPERIADESDDVHNDR